MSAFYSSPLGPHIGQCQNFILPAGDPHGHYCLAPVLGLGREVLDRDICGGCRMRSEAFRDRLLEQHLAGFEADPAAGWAWVDTANELLDREYAWLAERGAASEPMENLFKIKKDIRYREWLLEAVLDRLPPRVDTLQSML